MLWLYLHFPALQLDSLPATGQPRAIACNRRHVLVQINRAAQAEGLQLDMGLGLASSLCRNLEVHPYQDDFAPRRLQELAQRLYLVSADIMLFNPDGLLLKASPMLRYYHGLKHYWASLQHELLGERVQACGATDTQPLAARALARAGIECIGGDRQPPRWHALALAHSDLPGKAINQLQRIGVSNLGELVRLPLTELADRLDKTSIDYVQKLTGRKVYPTRFFTPAARFTRYRELECEADTTAPLMAPLARCLNALEDFLQTRDHVTATLTLQLLRRDRPAIHLKINAAQGERRAHTWQQLIELKLASLTLDAPVYAFRISAAQSYPRAKLVEDLFNAQTGQLERAELLSLLEAKLGPDALLQPSLNNDHRPEQRASCAGNRLTGDSGTPMQQRPSLLLDTPKATAEPLSIIHGPERITTGWWDQAPVMRDYYIARNRAGCWLWVYRPLQRSGSDRNWYIHGYFS
ncbi:DNA polymerase Y family protein [uncultured Gilvimarinus sp.]|uniref:Y-family DNA polymerase n=1 Tax=uncultured Gilvimarinus sp. TaxID=1689143 RepID=UPI0030D76946